MKINILALQSIDYSKSYSNVEIVTQFWGTNSSGLKNESVPISMKHVAIVRTTEITSKGD